MQNQLIIHFVWISGKRMIKQGTDGLSRGDFASGVMRGQDFLSFLPMNKSALERLSSLWGTILSWLKEPLSWNFASPTDWFDDTLKQYQGKWVWSPPPCLAKLAVEQLCKVKHMYPESQHVFVCPSLMTGYWRKSLGKIADSMFVIRAGSSVWSADMLESLTIAFVKPLLHRSPWRARRLPAVGRWEKSMSAVQWQDPTAIRRHMRKFWN